MEIAQLLNVPGTVTAAPSPAFWAELEALGYTVPDGDRDFHALALGQLDAEAAALRTALMGSGTAADCAEEASNHWVQYRQAQLNLGPWDERIPFRMHAYRAGNYVAREGGRIDLPHPAGLPLEFARYLNLLDAFHAADAEGVACAWDELTWLPAAERLHCTIPAAFLLARALQDLDAVASQTAYSAVRALPAQGFEDPTNLVGESLGSEGWVALHHENPLRASQLYGAQLLRGFPSAYESLRVAFDALADGDLDAAAADLVLAPLITAWVLDRYGYDDDSDGIESRDTNLQARWLTALEAANSTAVRADRDAWLAYQAGDYGTASRWLKRVTAPTTMSRWIDGKLALRRGDRRHARREIEAMVAAQPDGTFPDQASNSSIQFDFGPYGHGPTPGVRPLGELALLQLADGDLLPAFESFYRGGYGREAFYLAEQVLTVPEVVTLINRYTPTPDLSVATDNWTPPTLRTVLARRLAREDRWVDARPYYPTAFVVVVDSYRQALADGRNPKRDAHARAVSLYTAARIAHDSGHDLLDPATDPFPYTGFYEAASGQPSPPVRDAATGTACDPLLPIALIERRRVLQFRDEATQHDKYHRYYAADLSWEAAELLPDNSEACALVLCEAGRWLRYIDEQAADRFYKALVNRNRALPLGQDADALHWFPECGSARLLLLGPAVIPGIKPEED